MTAREEWMRCRTLSRRAFRATGGCFWNLDPDSDGYSLRIPNGTIYKIAIDGPTSSRFAEGQCRDGSFVLFEGTEHCSHPTANAAVHAARKSFAKASNGPRAGAARGGATREES